MNGANGNGNFYFDDFELDTARRLLKHRGEMVPLNAKAFDLFSVLVANRGRVLSKNELLDTVWADQFVEENNLTVHIAALRKVLGEKKGEHRYIVTVPGRGYEFVGELHGNGHEEVVVESREIKRIVIDEYPATVDHASSARIGPKTRKWAWVLGIFPLLAVAIGVAWLILPARSGSDVSPELRMTASAFPITAGLPQRVAISRDGKTVAYSRRLKGKDSIWLGDLESKSSIQITEDGYRLHDWIGFSPDGRTIYFTAKDDTHPDWTLMSVSAFGGAAKDLVVGVSSAVAISPGGEKIAYIKKDPATGLNALFVNDAATASNERLLFLPRDPHKFAARRVSWSPVDGRVTVAIADERGCSFTNVDPDSGSTAVIGEGLCNGTINFSWFDDGSGVVLTERSASDSDQSEVFTLQIPSGKKERVANDLNAYTSFSLSVSGKGQIAVLEVRNYPDVIISDADSNERARTILKGAGRGEGIYGAAIAPDERILYSVRVDETRAIWEMDQDGSRARELIAQVPDRQDTQFSVTPDNRFVVFDSDRSGKAEIWRANRDGSSPVAITSSGGNLAPALTPDGKFVLYMSVRDGIYNIWRIGVGGGDPVQLTYDNCSWPDVSPDGKYFACATGTATDGSKRQIAIHDISGGKPLKSFPVTPSSALYNRIRWSPDGDSIIYKDTVEGLWRQKIDGGEPERLPGFGDIRVFHFSFAAQNRLIYSGGTQMRRIVILEPNAEQ